MTGVRNYADLTFTELKKINPVKVICLMTVSPLEVHGPHLPLGTDVYIGEKLQQEYCKALLKQYPDFELLLLPPLFAGCDSLPVKGSITIRAKTLERFLLDMAGQLSKQGFKYLVICDNHGGPSHQIAMEVASRKAWRRYNFYLLNPFNVIYRMMVRHDKNFLQMINLSLGKCGDDADAHAGTNETSLMLATNPELVRDYLNVSSSFLAEKKGLSVVVGWLGKIFSKMGLVNISADLEHLANLVNWTRDAKNQPYLGSPSKANADDGERMIKGHVSIAVDLIGKSISGQRPFTKPMLWWLRLFRR